MAELKNYGKVWSYEEGKCLISVYANRKDEYFRTRHKKNFWASVLCDLEACNVLTSPTTAEQVESKWRTLYRAYKSAKDRGMGTSASKFIYLDEMDNIFHDHPIMSSPHSVSVGSQKRPTPAPVLREATQKPNQGNSSGIKETLIDIKKKYYQEKIEEKRETRKFIEEYLQKKEVAKERRHAELMGVLTKENQI